jgi:Rhodanese-like domain
MKKLNWLLLLFAICNLNSFAQRTEIIAAKTETKLPPSKVDFDAFETLTKEVKEYRMNRLVNLDKFLSYSKEKNTVILDTRSTEMYKRKHVKGAIHLNFSDFTQDNLLRLIPTAGTRILIYCNNNFADDELLFADKVSRPASLTQRPITLALNIPTFINLYGYGYKNVYELADLVSVFNKSMQFEGTDVVKAGTTVAGIQH